MSREFGQEQIIIVLICWVFVKWITNNLFVLIINFIYVFDVKLIILVDQSVLQSIGNKPVIYLYNEVTSKYLFQKPCLNIL